MAAAFDLNDLKLADLTPEEEGALRAYKTATDDPSGQSQCYATNLHLRGGLHLDEMTPGLSAIVRSLDTVFSRCPALPETLTVYRGTGHRAFIQKAEKGYRFRAPEFWSTSHVKASVERFVDLGGALLELTLPAGMPVYNMETLKGAGGHENEILLPRGILWEYVSGSRLENEEIPPLLRGKIECAHHTIIKAQLRPIARSRTSF